MEHYFNIFTRSSAETSSSNVVLFTTNAPINSKYKITFEQTLWSSGGRVEFHHSDSTDNTGIPGLTYDRVSVEKIFYATAGEIYMRGYRAKLRNIIITRIDENIYANVYLRPLKIQNIGKKGFAASIGEANGTYRGGLFLDETTEVTTGSITLGNAVGYIKININGKIIKIPYYN